MIFTFQIRYEGDDFNIIEFCAKTKDEAIQLFNTWCTQDEHQDKPYPITSIEVVYNKFDHEEYGDEYGLPENYTEV